MQRMRKKCTKLIDKAIKNFPTTYQLCNDDLNKFVLLLRKEEKVFFLINTSITGKNLMKLQYHLNKLITAN